MAASHFSGPMAIGAGQREVINTSVGKALTKDDNGKVLSLKLAGGFTVTLPALDSVDDGYAVRIRVETNPTTAYIVTEKASTDTNKVFGHILTSTGQTTAADFESSGATFVTFVASTAVKGDYVIIEKSGGNWFVRGSCTVPAAITIT